jgi:hypothetical protein
MVIAEANLGSTRKCVENYLLFTCITNQILALQMLSVGWRNLSRIADAVGPSAQARDTAQQEEGKECADSNLRKVTI